MKRHLENEETKWRDQHKRELEERNVVIKRLEANFEEAKQKVQSSSSSSYSSSSSICLRPCNALILIQLNQISISLVGSKGKRIGDSKH